MTRRRHKGNKHISFEALHVYSNDELFEQTVVNGAAYAKKVLTAWKTIEPEATYAIIVFVDDYSGNKSQRKERSEVVRFIRSSFEDAGIVVDYICFEADVADTCHFLKSDLVAAPQDGEGSIFGKTDVLHFDKKRNRITFDYVSLDWEIDTEGFRFYHDISEVKFRNDIGISISLGSEYVEDDAKQMIWSCPALSAWWQLIRLGILLRLDEPSLHGAPLGTWVRDHENRPPFVGTDTLTLLEQSYISVEHAVRVLLKNMTELSSLLKRPDEIPRFEEKDDAWLKKISYIFYE